jgi:hypothetical protein
LYPYDIILIMTRICITPFAQGTGGMASFRLKFEQGLKSRGIDVTYDLDDKSDAVLVIAGTRFLPASTGSADGAFASSKDWTASTGCSASDGRE